MIRDLNSLKKDSLFANIALLLLFPYSFLSGLSRFQGIHIIYPAFVISIIVISYIGFFCNQKWLFIRYIRVLLSVFVFMLLNIIIVGNIDIKYIVHAVIIMPCLALLLFFYKIRRWVSLLLFYGVSIYIGLYIFENGPFVGEENGLLVNSRNYVSYFVIFYSFPYFVHCYDYGKIPSLIPPIVCVIISIFAIGRAGIITSLIMLMFVLYIKMTISKMKSIYKLVIVTFLISLIFINNTNLFFDTYFSRFSEVGMDSYGRSECIKEYLSSLVNPINIVFGTPITSLRHTMSFQGGSLQNSYLALHSHEGLCGVFLVFLFFKGIYILIKNKLFVVLPAIIAIMLKGFSDSDMAGLYSGGDVVLYYVILVYYYFKKYENKSIGIIPAAVSSNSRK